MCSSLNFLLKFIWYLWWLILYQLDWATVPRYLVKYYSRCFCEGFFSPTEINIALSRLPSVMWWASSNQLKILGEWRKLPSARRNSASWLPPTIIQSLVWRTWISSFKEIYLGESLSLSSLSLSSYLCLYIFIPLPLPIYLYLYLVLFLWRILIHNAYVFFIDFLNF